MLAKGYSSASIKPFTVVVTSDHIIRQSHS